MPAVRPLADLPTLYCTLRRQLTNSFGEATWIVHQHAPDLLFLILWCPNWLQDFAANDD